MSASEDYALEVEAARAAALAASAVVSSFIGRPLQVQRKPGDEPVTDADLAANHLIVERLAAAFPDDVILSEELPDDGSRHGASRVWMVDPIDGTHDFIRGLPGFAVMIGLCVDGRPTVGVVSQPSTGKTYVGVVGGEAWLERGAERRPLRPSTLAQPPGIRLVASKSHRSPRIDAVRRALGIEDEVNIGSVGLKIGLVAEGERDLYVYTGGSTKLWDSCAPEAILRAAGGRLTDTHGRPLDYIAEDLHNRRGIIASNGPLHDHVLAAIAPLLVVESSEPP